MTSRREEHEAYLERILSNSLSSANPSEETFQRAQKDSFTYYNNLKFGVDGNCVYNLSGQTVWFEKNGVLCCVGANELKML